MMLNARRRLVDMRIDARSAGAMTQVWEAKTHLVGCTLDLRLHKMVFGYKYGWYSRRRSTIS